jgi:acyl-CoA synthetase (AMP-forming)/AMP-acid ligase II
MCGYEADPDLTRQTLDERGWLHTGDLGRLDADGYLYVTGRLRALIVLGSGKKVYPEEVEAAILRSPLVREAAVVAGLAADHVVQGTEQVWAIVVPADHAAAEAAATNLALQALLEREVQRAVQDLAPHKHPRRLILASEALPRTTTLKVKRAELGAWLDRHLGVRP